MREKRMIIGETALKAEYQRGFENGVTDARYGKAAEDSRAVLRQEAQAPPERKDWERFCDRTQRNPNLYVNVSVYLEFAAWWHAQFRELAMRQKYEKLSERFAEVQCMDAALRQELEGLADKWDFEQIELNNQGEPERAEEAGRSADELRALLAKHFGAAGLEQAGEPKAQG